MCGIAGWATLDPKQPPMFGDEMILLQMCDAIWHRGPDSAGYWLGEGVALGMRRLAIIDLSTGEQPVWNETRTVAVVMNGELYNFREIRADLEAKGHTFVGHSDTEILPHLYEEYGEDFVKHLNGMFAIALWDLKKRKLIISRDRFGEKPLFYGIFGDKLLFASEPKAILTHADARPEIDLESVRHFISYDYVPAPRSIYSNISKLPAAHSLIFEDGRVRIERYWKLSFEKTNSRMSFRDATEELGRLIDNSVEKRMISDVPLGVLLSGGVDSSAVAAYSVKHSSEKVKTFSIGFSEESFDESAYAREVAEHLGTEHYEDKLSVDSSIEIIQDIGKWLDEPMSDPSILPTFLLSQFVRKHVTVALGGDGGDEIFAGYPMYYGVKMAKMYSAIPRVVRNSIIEPMVRGLPVNTNNLSFDYKAKRFIDAARYDKVTRHHTLFGSFSPEQQNSVVSESVKFATRNSDVHDGARAILAMCDATSEVEQMQYLDMNLYLAEDILTKVDRASMAVSLEVRAPFLDHKVAEFAASIPPEYKLRGSNGKVILKKLVEPMLPKSVTKRAKKGFGIPIADWLKGRLNYLMHELLAPDRLIRQDIFNYEYVQQLIREHEQGIASHHKQLWTLMVFQFWYDNFIEASKPPVIKTRR